MGKPVRARCPKCGTRVGGTNHQYVDTGTDNPCPSCGGTGRRNESLCGTYTTAELWRSLPFRVYRQDRAISWNESFLGYGCVYSCADYGRAWAAEDSATLAAVREGDGRHQLIKVVRESDMRLCDHIGIFLNRGGYSVRAVWGDPAPIAHRAASELSEDEGRIAGGRIAALGGNGTLFAALAQRV